MRRPRPGLVVTAAGLGVALIGGLVTLGPAYEAAQWQASSEAARAQRNADAPRPIWLTPVARGALAEPAGVERRVGNASRVEGLPPDTRGWPTRPALAWPTAMTRPLTPPSGVDASTPDTRGRPSAMTGRLGTPSAVDGSPTDAPTVEAAPELTMSSASFTFDDPPEPGAHAHLTITIHNPSDQPAGPVSVALPLSWLAGYRLAGTDPPVLGGGQTSSDLYLVFEGPAAGSDLELTLNVLTIDEVVDAPSMAVLDAAGRLVARGKPATAAPPPRPGPIYSIDIPRLRLHTGVVPVDWEPPLFVVGQVRTTAYVSEGNSVLVGHLRGAAGYNVFNHLDQLAPGDEVVANSRGKAYQFVVASTQVLPEDDTSPTETTALPRLTLMTCAGDWNPITRDYGDRLWVIAEPAAPD